MEGIDIQAIIRTAIEDFARGDHVRTDAAYRAGVEAERRNRQSEIDVLAKRVELLELERNQRTRLATYAEREAVIRCELRRLGVADARLSDAYQLVIAEAVAQGRTHEYSREWLTAFVGAHPELRIAAGMSEDQARAVYEDVVRVKSQPARGL